MKTLLVLLTLLTLHSQLPTVYSQWSTDPNVNLQVSTWGQYPVACTDGDGGVYIRWEANSYTTSQYIQRVNKYGYKWPQLVEVYGTQNGTGFTGKICPDDSNGVIVLFMEWNVSGIDPQYFFNRRVRVNRIDSTGQKLWGEYGVRVSMRDTGQAIREIVPDGQHGCVVAFLVGPDSLYVQRISSSGERVWGEEGVFIADLFSNTIYAVSDSRGGIIIEFGAGWFQKIDSTGNTAWAVLPPTPYSFIRSDGQGGILMAHNRYVWGEDRIIVNRMNPDGTFRWGEYGVTVDDSVGPNGNLSDVLIDESNSIVLAWQKTTTSQYPDTYTQRIDSNGSMQWPDNHRITSSLDYSAGCRLARSDSNSVIYIWAKEVGLLGQRLNSSGEQVWGANDVDITHHEITAHLNAVPSISGAAIAVWDEAPLAGVFVQQVNKMGSLGTITTIQTSTQFTSGQFMLNQNYPNPFNGLTTIEFYVRNIENVELTITNVLGQHVRTVLKGPQSSGLHQIPVDLTRYASGVYIIRLSTSAGTQCRRMTYVK